MKARKQQAQGPACEHVFIWAVDWERLALPEDRRVCTLHIVSSHDEITDALLREIRRTLGAWIANKRILDTDADFRVIGVRPVEHGVHIVRLSGAEG